MANKKYIIRSFKPGNEGHNHINPLLNLSMFGMADGQNILKSSLSIGASQTINGIGAQEQTFNNFYEATGANQFLRYKDLTKNTAHNYAFYDQSYSVRRLSCQQMARNNKINFILETIANEAIVLDENGYCAQLDIDKLKLFLNKDYNFKGTDSKTDTNADKLIRDCKIAFNTVYSCLGWQTNNGAYTFFKKFLINGFIALEIIFDKDKKHIIGFKEIDPATLEPGIKLTEDGQEVFIWYQYKGQINEVEIPESNIIYISWSDIADFKNYNISYVEGLTRSFTMLQQLEHSQLIWNIQNAQKRMKITVPVGDMAPSRSQQYVSQIMADYSEEVTFDEWGGQMLVNGEPKFNFQKTYVFEDRGGSTVGLEEIATEGYNMNTTESLQYFWREFILESQVPVNRFNTNISSPTSNALHGDSTVTREEYAFSRFIQRIQNVFKDIILKPVWVQICLLHPELALTNYIKQGLGIVFNEENLFTLAKKRNIVAEGANAVSTLMGIQDADGKPYFSVEFAVKEYLGLSDNDLEINRKYKESEILKQIEIAKLQKKHQEDANNTQAVAQPGEGSAEGGGFGGGGHEPDMGGGFGGGAPEPDMGGEAAEEPTEGGF